MSPEATWKAIGLSESAYRNLLRSMYLREKMSQGMIAKRLGVVTTTVEDAFRKYGLQRSKSRSQATHQRYQRDKAKVKLSASELEVLDGLMLGDGHLELAPGGQSARYCHSSKHAETLRAIAQSLRSLTFSAPKKFFARVWCWWMKSLSYAQLLPLYQRWYGTGRKAVPADLKITKAAAYWWFIGDGSITRSRYDIKLSSEGFSERCRRIITLELQRSGIKSRIDGAGRIWIPATHAQRFYAFIGSCKNPEYSYKWDYLAPKWTFSRIHVRGPRRFDSGET